MDGPPQAYEQTYETRVVTQPAAFNAAFLRSLHGILKIIEVVLSIIVLICVASLHGWSYTSSGGWTNFVAAFTLILSALLFVFYLFNLIFRFPRFWVFIEFTTLVGSCVLWFVTFIVCATVHYYGSGAIASAVFSICATAVYIAELVTRATVTRGAGVLTISMTGITTTSGTHPTVAPASSPMGHTPGVQETRMGFAEQHPPRHQPDEGYIMP